MTEAHTTTKMNRSYILLWLFDWAIVQVHSIRSILYIFKFQSIESTTCWKRPLYFICATAQLNEIVNCATKYRSLLTLFSIYNDGWLWCGFKFKWILLFIVCGIFNNNRIYVWLQITNTITNACRTRAHIHALQSPFYFLTFSFLPVIANCAQAIKRWAYIDEIIVWMRIVYN